MKKTSSIGECFIRTKIW